MCERTQRHSGSREVYRMPNITGRPPEVQGGNLPELPGTPARTSPLSAVTSLFRPTRDKPEAPVSSPTLKEEKPPKIPTPVVAEVAPERHRKPTKTEKLLEILKTAAGEEGRYTGKRREMKGVFQDATLRAVFRELYDRPLGPKELKPNYRGKLMQSVREGLDLKTGHAWESAPCPEFLRRPRT